MRGSFLRLIDNVDNPYHPLVWIHGRPRIGRDVYIGGFSEVNARGARVVIGRGCDIASFVVINVADSHRKCLGMAAHIERRSIVLEDHVFVGSMSVIKGGAHIGHHSVVAAGTIVGPGRIPPYSLVCGNPMQVRPGYYRNHAKERSRKSHARTERDPA